MIAIRSLLRSSIQGQSADNAIRAIAEFILENGDLFSFTREIRVGEVDKEYRAGESADYQLGDVLICEFTNRKRISTIERDSIHRGW